MSLAQTRASAQVAAPNAQFDPAKQWLKSAIFEIAGDLTYTAQRSMHPQPPHRRSSMKRGRVVIRPEGTANQR
jgi:hypothetical protein